MHRLTAALLALALLISWIPCSSNDALADGLPGPEAIKALQLDLIAAGFLSGGADGVMGPATEEAIRSAQQALGLAVSGQISSELLSALRRDAFPLRRDSRGGLVYELQKPLWDWGFLESEPDGSFGAATEGAVVELQRLAVADFAAWMQARSDEAYAAMDAPADLAVDLPLYSAENIPCDGAVTEDWFRFLVDEYHFAWVTAAPGDAGDGVKLIQRRLHALGYLYSGPDGSFGAGTELALRYFQRRNSLPQTGGCDAATSAALFSKGATRSDEYVMPYAALVRRAESRVYILGWDGAGYNVPVKRFKCSCGARRTPTIEGTFYCEGPIAEWYYMQSSKVWVRYAFKIQGNYFFHSVLFRHRGDKNPTPNSKASLGENVSHGCIRLAVDDIRWMYENCPKGLKVVIE